jgi:hypothetical protein
MRSITIVVRVAAYSLTGAGVGLAVTATRRLWGVLSYNERTLMILVLSVMLLLAGGFALSMIKINEKYTNASNSIW